MAETQRPQLYTVPLGTALADALAAYLLARESGDGSLADSLILMPNNRAIKSLTESFVRIAPKGLLLPRMVAVGDLALDEKLPVLLDPIGIIKLSPIPPAIDVIERRILLARLIQQRRPTTTAVEALKLSSKLTSALDALEVEEIALDRVKAADLTDDMQAHWQAAYQDFLAIAADYHSALKARNLLSPPARRNMLLRRFAELLPRDVPVIAAGITTAAPAIAALLKAVVRLPQGLLVLPHVDLAMPQADWDALGPVKREGLSDICEETHPQYHLKLLLDAMAFHRDEVAIFPGTRQIPALESVDRIFARADQVLHWSALAPALKKLPQARVMSAADSAEEALAIAILIREALEVPEKRIALVTPDRELGVRVSAQLSRWCIHVDDSAGQPLIQLQPATLLLGLAELAADQMGPVSLLAVLKHPLVRAGEMRMPWLDMVRVLDLTLRGPRLGLGVAAAADAIQSSDLPDDKKLAVAGWWADTAPIFTAFDNNLPEVLSSLLDQLVTAATLLTDGKVWQGHAGRQLAQLLQDYRATDLAAFGNVERGTLPAIIRQLLDSEVSRPVFGSHPRVAIYGLLEARLQQADLVICGGLNEGVWPQTPQPDPWLSPQLRHELKLPGLDRNIGLSAHDLLSLLGSKDVVLSRSIRDRSGPTIASRFLLRIQALIGTQLQEETNAISWARQIDKGETVPFAEQPKPNPSREQRRVEISVTQIETLRADPFAFYANKILGLKALRQVGGEPDSAWRGVVIHHILEKWAKEDGYIPEKLVARAGAMLANPAFHPAVRVLWQPRLTAALTWVAQETNEMRASGRNILKTEIWGSLTLSGVQVKGQADRIDRDASGGLIIVDYKSGQAPSPKSVKAGFRIQLGLLGAMAESGTMEGVKGQSIGFEYWSLAKNDKRGFGSIKSPAKAKNGEIAEVVPNALRFAREAVENWITGDAPFTAKLHPEYAYSDYDHLMRLNEWYGRQDSTHDA